MNQNFNGKNHCALATACNDNTDSNPDNIIFTIKKLKIYVPLVTLSAQENQKLSKILSRGFEKSVYWNEYKTKVRRKIKEIIIDIKQSNFMGVNQPFVWIYPNQDDNLNKCEKNIIYQKLLSKIIIS